jgi:hypothetical protein
MDDLTRQPPPAPSNNEGEEAVRERLTELNVLFDQRADAVRQGDQATVDSIEVKIVVTMRKVGDAYPDNESKSEWYKQAELFESGSSEEKEHILMPLTKGLGILIAAPFAVAGGAIFAAGGILYGAGKTIQGVGNLLTGGMLQ